MNKNASLPFSSYIFSGYLIMGDITDGLPAASFGMARSLYEQDTPDNPPITTYSNLNK